MSPLPLSGVNSRFLAPPPFPAFHSDCPVFLAYLYFEEKKRSVRSDRRQVELRRLGNQLSVVGKANSLCKIVKCCVCCLFVKLRLSPGCVRPGIKGSFYIAQYPVRWTAQTALHFLTPRADLFIPTPTRLLRKHSSQAAITRQG